MVTGGDYASNDTVERSASMSSVAMACKREEKFLFFFTSFFFLIKILFFFFFFQSCYKGNSLHDYKLKNTQECTTQVLTSKPMYKENKCIWGCITWCRSCIAIKPCVCVCVCTCSQDLKLAVKQTLELLAPSSSEAPELKTSQLVACFQCPFSLTYVVASYGCCCSCCSCSTKVFKKKRSSNNSRTQETNKQKKPKKLKAKKNLPFSTLSDREEFFLELN